MAHAVPPQEDLDALLSVKAAEIGALRAALESLPSDWDDIWLLRYVLSFKSQDERVAAIRKCLAWRTTNAEPLAAVAAGQVVPKDAHIRRCMVAGLHGESALGEPLVISRASLSRPAEIFTEGVTPDDLVLWIQIQREQLYRLCDASTRARRRLIKTITVIDLSGVGLEHVGGSAYHKAIGAASKISEFLFPQLLAKSVLFRPPYMMSAVYPLFRNFLSPKTVAKISLCPATSHRQGGGGVSSCPFASTRFDTASLPSFLGGACTCPTLGGCVGGIPNACSGGSGGGCGAGGDSSIAALRLTIPAGGAKEVYLPVKREGCRLAWEVCVEAHGIEFSARLEADNNAEPLSLSPARKVKAEEGAVAGGAALQGVGCVVLRFDNAHSMFTAKCVTLSAAVVDEAAEAELVRAMEQTGVLDCAEEA